MIIQTNQFIGVSPETLYNAYLSSEETGKMTSQEDVIATYHRLGVGDVAIGETGDELRAWGFTAPDGSLQYFLRATILRLVPGKLVVMSWKNLGWNMATDPENLSDLESTLVLTFKPTIFGAEIHVVHANVPDYEVYIPDTGEKLPLSTIINTHWGLQYWEPMKKYFANKK
jgi:hypothetical protein